MFISDSRAMPTVAAAPLLPDSLRSGSKSPWARKEAISPRSRSKSPVAPVARKEAISPRSAPQPLSVRKEAISPRSESPRPSAKSSIATPIVRRKGVRRSGTMQLPLRVHAIGSGGLDELANNFNDGTVSWALLRFQVGSGTFAREKLVSVVCTGADTPTVKKGRLSSRREEALDIIGHSHVTIDIARGKELTLEYVSAEIDRINAFKSDDMGDFSFDKTFSDYGQRNKEIVLELAPVQDDKKPEAKPEAEPEAEPAAEPAASAHEEGPKAKKRSELSSGEAFAALGTPLGECNWVMLEAQGLTLFDAGDRGLEEMKEAFVPDEVLFAGLRFTFPREDSPPIQKFVFVHWIGPEVPPAKRGQWNAKLVDAKNKMREHFCITFQKTAHCLDDIDASDLLSEMRRLTYDIGANADVSLKWYLQGLEAEMEAKKERARMAAAQPSPRKAEPSPRKAEPSPRKAEPAETRVTPAAPPPKIKQPQVDEAIAVVRQPGGKWNWVILAALLEDDEVNAQTTLPHDEF